MITRMIYPFSLRERIAWKISKFFPNVNDKNISFIFDKKIKFDLSKYDIGHQSIIFNGYYELGLTCQMLKFAKRGGYL
jgi:hypothetical protein